MKYLAVFAPRMIFLKFKGKIMRCSHDRRLVLKPKDEEYKDVNNSIIFNFFDIVA